MLKYFSFCLYFVGIFFSGPVISRPIILNRTQCFDDCTINLHNSYGVALKILERQFSSFDRTTDEFKFYYCIMNLSHDLTCFQYRVPWGLFEQIRYIFNINHCFHKCADNDDRQHYLNEKIDLIMGYELCSKYANGFTSTFTRSIFNVTYRTHWFSIVKVRLNLNDNIKHLDLVQISGFTNLFFVSVFVSLLILAIVVFFVIAKISKNFVRYLYVYVIHFKMSSV